MKLNRPKFLDLSPGQFPEDQKFDVVEPKYDGWWGQLVLDGHVWELYSRTGMLKKSGVLKRKFAPTILHGEYCYGTEWSKDRPHFYDKLVIHGAQEMNGRDARTWTNEYARGRIENFVELLDEEEIRNGVRLIEQFRLDHAKQFWQQQVLSGDLFEGLVFKDSQGVWGSEYARMKRGMTMEYVAIGFKASDAESYKGVAIRSISGGLYFDGVLKHVCWVGGGLELTERKAIWSNPASFAGKVFEASGKKISKKGALRHPSFERWRSDKKPEDCRWPA